MKLTKENAKELLSLKEKIKELEFLKENMNKVGAIQLYESIDADSIAFIPFAKFEMHPNLKSGFLTELAFEIARLKDEIERMTG